MFDHTYQFSDDLEDLIPGRYGLVLIARDYDLLRALVGELDVDVELFADLGHHGAASTDDLRVVLGVHVYGDLETLQLLVKENIILNQVLPFNDISLLWLLGVRMLNKREAR